jgi:tetratricopeptide (TPR) repeat protein
VLRRKDLDLSAGSAAEVALPAAKALGASDLILGEITRAGGKYSVTARRMQVGRKTVTRTESATGDLPAVAVELLQKLFDLKVKDGPFTTSEKALEEVTLCWKALVRIPLQARIGAPPALEGSGAVEARCKAALAADPKLGWARAGLGVIQVLRGDPGAGRALAKESQKGRFSAAGVVVEAFAARRMGDRPASKAALEAGIKLRPGFLLALSYLAEDQMDAEEYRGAADAWERFLKRVPHHPYAMAQKGKALGYLKQHREALSLTRQALDFDPGDPELLIELGSRLIDAGQHQEAESSLRTAMEATPPRALAWLRLGYLYLLQKRVQDAQDLLVAAVKYAVQEDEGRTRALAFVDLAQIAAMQGKQKGAIEYLGAARSEGLRKLPCAEPAFAPLKGQAEFEAVCKPIQ